MIKQSKSLSFFILCAVFSFLWLISCGGGSGGSDGRGLAISGAPDNFIWTKRSFSFTPAVSNAGGTLTFSVSGAPGWTSFDTGTGTLSGRPTAQDNQTSAITITVTDGSDSAQLPFNLVVRNFPVLKTGQSYQYGYDDDGKYQFGITMSYTRDDANNIVKDNATGLEWQDDDEVLEIKDWADAASCCTNLRLGNHTDWRLPDIHELTSIANYKQIYPAMSYGSEGPDDFVNTIVDTSAATFWSSQLRSIYATEDAAQVVNFYDGGTVAQLHANPAYVRCVRAGE